MRGRWSSANPALDNGLSASKDGHAAATRSLAVTAKASIVAPLELTRVGHLKITGRSGQRATLVTPDRRRVPITLPVDLPKAAHGVYRVWVDRSARRLPPYKLAIQLEPGRLAQLEVPDVNDSSLPAIHVAGIPYPLPASLSVRRHDMPKAMSFYAAQARLSDRGRVFASRRLPNGQAVETLPQASMVTRMIVLHADVMPDTKSMFKLLVSRELSTHFAIDWDGTIHQLLDPIDTAFAAAEVNPYSIHIDLNNLLPNLVDKPRARATPGGHPRRREMARAPYLRPRSPRLSINRRDVMSYGYNEPQYRALIALTQLLTGLFERIQPRVPLDERGQVPLNYFDAAEDFEGVVAHWHLTPRRWDPGPGFNWQRLRDGLGGLRIHDRDATTPPRP